VVTPKITSLQKDNPYVSVLLGGNTPLEELFYKMGETKKDKEKL